MQGTENVGFMTNMETILQFPKNDAQAQIIADDNDTLCCHPGNFFALRDNSTIFEKTAKVIDLTCRCIIEKIKEASERTDELLAKAKNVQSSLKDIHKVYHTSLGDTNQGVTLLQSTITLFDDLFFQMNVGGESTILTNSWVVMEMPTGNTQEGAQGTNTSTSTGWWPSSGVLPGIYNLYTTAKQYTLGSLSPCSYTPSSDPISLAGQQRVSNSGKQLSNADAYKYILGLCKTIPFNAIHSFYIGSPIDTKTLDDINKDILSAKESFEKNNLPIVIPVGFEYDGYLERNHIALILIKDNCVEYYDSKGTPSQEKTLYQNSGTFRNVLASCLHLFTPNGKIHENTRKDQFDINNCVVFVCYHLYNRLIKNSPIGEFDLLSPTLQEIAAFRETIIEIAYPPNEKDEVVEDTNVLAFSFNDFETK